MESKVSKRTETAKSVQMIAYGLTLLIPGGGSTNNENNNNKMIRRPKQILQQPQ